MTDDFLMRCFERDPARLREMFERATELRAEEPAEQDEQDNAPSTTDAAPVRTSGPERRDNASTHGPLALPTRTPQAGLTLTTTERQATWPFR
jgi:hypothetical protein